MPWAVVQAGVQGVAVSVVWAVAGTQVQGAVWAVVGTVAETQVGAVILAVVWTVVGVLGLLELEMDFYCHYCLQL